MPPIGQCAICFSTLLSNEIYVITKCGHTFHQPCIKQWIQTGKSCSSCRVKATEKDVIKLYIQETNLDDTFSTQHVSDSKIVEMQSELEKVKEKNKKLKEENTNVAALNRTLELQINQNKNNLRHLDTLRVQNNFLKNKNDEIPGLQREVADYKKKLHASDFYNLIIKGGTVADEFKQYVDSEGKIVEAGFLKLMNGECVKLKKRLDVEKASRKELEQELKAEKVKSRERKDAINKLKAELKRINEEYEAKGKAPKINPKLKEIMNYSPAPRKKSLGFTFEYPDVPLRVLDSAHNDKRAKKRVKNVEDAEEENEPTPCKRPSPSKKSKAFSFDSEGDSDYEPSSSSAPTTSFNVATPVPRFTRNASSTKSLGSKFGTTIGDKRATSAPLKDLFVPIPSMHTRSMKKNVQKNASIDDSVICLD